MKIPLPTTPALRALCLFAFVFTTVFLLLHDPPGGGLEDVWDKAKHFVVYGGMAFMLWLALGKKNALLAFAMVGILPTPAIGGLGVLDRAEHCVGQALQPGLHLVLIGATEGWLGQSLWLREVAGREDGPPPPVDLQAERRNGDFVRGQILAGAVRACHDVSDGGLLVAVAEMALAGRTGAGLEQDGSHAFWFGEDQARYVLAVPDAAPVLHAAAAAGVPAIRLGAAGGDGLTLPGGVSISLEGLRAAHERFFPAWMES